MQAPGNSAEDITASAGNKIGNRAKRLPDRTQKTPPAAHCNLTWQHQSNIDHPSWAAVQPTG